MSKEDIQNAKPVDPGKVTPISKGRKRGGGGGGSVPTARPFNPYRIHEGAIYWDRQTQDGPRPTQLCNFVARIERQLVYDDGLSRDVRFEITAEQNGYTRPPVVVSASEFGGMGWVVHNWGASFVISQGSGTKDHLRAAIQLLSGNVPEVVIYRHTGWRKFGDAWWYLHVGGALGANGQDENVMVDIGTAAMQEYLLPAPFGYEANVEAVHTALGLLTVCPTKPDVGVLAMSSVLRAVLAEALPANSAVHLTGTTGTRKSTVAAIAQAFFGAGFNSERLPAAWVDTHGAIEAKLHMLKDALAVVDDFKPQGTRTDVQQLNKLASKVIQSLGNQLARGKLTETHDLAAGRPARAFMLSTGEDTPGTESSRARMLIGWLDKGDVDLARVTELQIAAESGQLAGCLAGWVQALAPLIDHLKQELPKRMVLERAALPRDWHGRTSGAVASMAACWDVFGSYAVHCGAMTAAQWQAFRSAIRGVLFDVGAEQADTQRQDNEAHRFIQYLDAMLLTSRVHLNRLSDDGRPPEKFHKFAGWRDKEMDSAGSREVVASGECIGWVDDATGLVHLEITATFQAMQKYASQSGETLGVTKQTMGRRLKDSGLLASYEKGRGSQKLPNEKDGRRRARCWVLSVSSFSAAPNNLTYLGQVGQKEKTEGKCSENQQDNPPRFQFVYRGRSGAGGADSESCPTCPTWDLAWPANGVDEKTHEYKDLSSLAPLAPLAPVICTHPPHSDGVISESAVDEGEL